MSDTIIVAIITACATTIPNILIAFVNNRFQYKMKRFETYKLSQREALIKFNEMASEYYSVSQSSHRINYEKSLNDLYIYFPKINTSFIGDLEKAREKQDWSSYYPILRKTMKYLSSYIEK